MRVQKKFFFLRKILSASLIIILSFFNNIAPCTACPPENIIGNGIPALQVPSIFAQIAGNPELENRIRIETGLILASVLEDIKEKKPVSFISINARLDTMYEFGSKRRALELISNPFTKEGITIVDVELLHGPNMGKKFRIMSSCRSMEELQKDESLLSIRPLTNDDITIGKRPSVPDPATLSWGEFTPKRGIKSAHAGIHFHDGKFYLSAIGKDAGSININGSDEKVKVLEIPPLQDIEDFLLASLQKIEREKNIKFISTGISGLDREQARLTGSLLWRKGEMVSFFPMPQGFSMADITNKNAISASNHFHNTGGYDIVQVELDDRPAATISLDNSLQVKLGGSSRAVKTHDLVRPEDYKDTVDEQEWQMFEHITKTTSAANPNVVFFSSTPQGGGVALMRHRLISLLRSKGINANWHVMYPDLAVFNVTKTEMHNPLQGITGKPLTQEDKKLYEDWIRKNAFEIFPDVIKNADVIVIDDYQPSGMVPLIKEMNPNVKIIYRSHIQLQSHLINDSSTPQHETWNYIWNNIKDHIDLFVSHPIDSFIPEGIPEEKILLMPATTDPLDGLNKPLSTDQISYNLGLFNDTLETTGQTPLDNSRPHIAIQVARFDPAKGISDVIKASSILKERMLREGIPIEKIPQIVIVGHGAVDDTEGDPIFKETRKMLKKDEFRHIADDVKVALLPHHDQVLNALMRASKFALQLSHAEGFEVKVSEALDKGKPVIAYRVGGIPRQIKHGVNGFLVDKIGDVKKVAEHMYECLTDERKYITLSHNARTLRRKDVWTVPNASNWLYMIRELFQGRTISGNRAWTRDLAIKDFMEYQRKTLLQKAKRDISLINNASLSLLNTIKKSSEDVNCPDNPRKSDFQIDLSLIPGRPPEEIRRNARTIAGIILQYREFKNTNFVFSKGFPLLDGRELPSHLKNEIMNAPDPDTFMPILRDELRKMAQSRVSPEETEDIIRNRLLTYDPERYAPGPASPIQIPLISRELALWMRSNSVELDEEQFPVIMDGLNGELKTTLPLRNFEAGFIVGLSKADLAIARENLRRAKKNSFEEFARLKKDILLRLNNLYDIVKPEVQLDEETLEYLIDNDPFQRLNRAIDTSIPPVTRIPVDENMEMLHENIHVLLKAA